MKLYSEGENYKLYHGNMLDLAEIIKPNTIGAVITDPPYELNFMGKGWDNSGIAFQADTWRKCHEVLKPGGYLLAFGGSRTFHRIAVAIEDAGFEIRDVIIWLYGSGFPKSMNIGKGVEAKLTTGSANTQEFKKLAGTKTESGGWGISKNSLEYGARPSDYSADGHLMTVDVDYTTEEGRKWDGWGTALKPSYEPIIVARKPCEGSCVDNVLKYGVGGLNIEDCRIGNETIKGGTAPNFRDVGRKQLEVSGVHKLSFGQISNAERIEYADHEGRFPANTILTYDDSDFNEVCGGLGTNGDSGNACRYFYTAKAGRKDREDGCKDLEDGILRRMRPDKDDSNPTGLNKDGKFAPITRKNTHPTVKPCELMQYLVRLVTPDNETVLDTFNGSGSTGKAVMLENAERGKHYKYIGIELTDEYLPIAKARIEYAINGPEFEEIVYENGAKQMSIFDFIGE